MSPPLPYPFQPKHVEETSKECFSVQETRPPDSAVPRLGILKCLYYIELELSNNFIINFLIRLNTINFGIMKLIYTYNGVSVSATEIDLGNGKKALLVDRNDIPSGIKAVDFLKFFKLDSDITNPDLPFKEFK